MNKKCQNCNKTDKPVYERYQSISGNSVKIKPKRITDKLYELVPEGLEYWCNDCYGIQNSSIEYKD